MQTATSAPATLQAAISKLQAVRADADKNAIDSSSPACVDPNVIAAAARAVTRAADEVELAALETADRKTRARLMRSVAEARVAGADARAAARRYALAWSRHTLLFAPVGGGGGVIAGVGNGLVDGDGDDDTGGGGGRKRASVKLGDGDGLIAGDGGAIATLPKSVRPSLAASLSPPGGIGQPRRPASKTEALARDVNDALRRTSAAVADEVARSRAAGDVVDQSTRRLAATRDQHALVGGALRKGGKTLGHLRTSEMVANAVVVLSFAFFFIVAAYVASRRVRSSVVVSVVVRPAVRVAFAPVGAVWRLVRWGMKGTGPRRRSDDGGKGLTSREGDGRSRGSGGGDGDGIVGGNDSSGEFSDPAKGSAIREEHATSKADNRHDQREGHVGDVGDSGEL